MKRHLDEQFSSDQKIDHHCGESPVETQSNTDDEWLDRIHGLCIHEKEDSEGSERILEKLNCGNDGGEDLRHDELKAMQEDMIVLKVGNVEFYTCKSTVREIDGFSQELKDRNSHAFVYILEYLRKRQCNTIGIDILNYDQLRGISEEAQFFKLNELKEYVDNLITRYHLNECSATDQGMDKTVRDRVSGENIEQSVRNLTSQVENLRNNSNLLAKQLYEKYQNFVNYNTEGDASVNLNISGQLFSIPFPALAKFDNFLITKYIQLPSFKLNHEGHIFIDRNPDLFKMIHGYIISHGKFNHLPRKLSNERRKQLFLECEFYGLDVMIKDYLDPCRYRIELLSPENIRLKEREDKLRELFVKDSKNELLKDPYLYLSPLFEIKDVIHSKERFKINFGNCPKLLDLCDITTYSKQGANTCLVSNLETFKYNFTHFTKRLFEGLDWNGVFIAGGSVLGCCLKEVPNEDQPLIAQPSPLHYIERDQYYEDKEFNDSDNFHIVGASFRKSFFLENDHLNRFEFHNHNTRKTIPTSDLSTKPIDTSNAREVTDPNIPHAFKKSDIDLFLYAMSEEEAELKIKHVYQTIKQNLSVLISSDTRYKRFKGRAKDKLVVPPTYSEAREKFINDDILIVRTKFAVTFYMYRLPPVQIVLRIYKSPAEILLGFDVDSCTIGFDGSNVWCSDRAIRALSHKANLVDVDRQSTTYTYRLFKYAKRGFSVSVPGYHHSLVKNQYLHYPRRVVCSHLKDKLGGLARLILYDRACRSRNPKKLLGSYYDDESIRANQLELSKEIVEKKSDYLDLTVLKYEKKTPQMLDQMLSLNSHYNQKPYTFLIHSLNNLDYILDAKDSLEHSDVSNRIEWITIEPTTQKVGSFNPITSNFYYDAYHPVQPNNLLLLDDLRFGTKELQIQQWYKTVKDTSEIHPSSISPIDTRIYPKTKSSRYDTFTTDTDNELNFEIYPPEISNRIERLFRQFLFLGNPVEFEISPYEKIDFLTWQVIYSSDHPLYPNSSDFLYRNGIENELPLDYEQLRDENELPEDCKVVKGLCRKSFY